IQQKKQQNSNNETFQVLEENGQFIQKQLNELQIGQIIKIQFQQRLPCDIVLLYTKNQNSQCVISTQFISGQTDYINKVPITYFQQQIQINQDNYDNFNFNYLDAFIKIKNENNELLDKFEGSFKIIQHDGEIIKQSLNAQNVVWYNSILHSNEILGIIINVGINRKIFKNQQFLKSKFSKFNSEINYIFFYVFFIFFQLLYLTFILLSSIIPISLKINLDIAKIIYIFKINCSKDIEGVITQNSFINEDLGKIQYLLCDKTGTLTQDELKIKYVYVDNQIYTDNQITSLKHSITQKSILLIIYKQFFFQIIFSIYKKPRNQQSKSFDLIKALAICNSVILDQEKKVYQGNSPDEISLVEFANNLGISLTYRNAQIISISIQNEQNNIQEDFQVLHVLDFTEENRRMGIIVENQNKIIFYLKGDDNIIKQYINDKAQSILCENQANELTNLGLRTLAFSQRTFDKNFIIHWIQQYQQAQQLQQNRNHALKKLREQIEKQMEYLGVVGLDESLQENIIQTITNFKNAGIKLWMLTGDKIENATFVATASGIRGKNQIFQRIQNVYDDIDIKAKLQYFQSDNNKQQILAIDGQSLKVALEEYEQKFVEICLNAQCVIFAKCSSLLKKQIIDSIKKYSNVKIAAIGDGDNDIKMIQNADIGIGFYFIYYYLYLFHIFKGINKGNKCQAALNADFQINKFSDLNQLLLWHGRLIYTKSAMITQFILQRGLIISFIQMIFICMFQNVQISALNDKLIVSYATIFNILPVFSIIFDQDANVNIFQIVFLYLFLTKSYKHQLKILNFIKFQQKIKNLIQKPCFLGFGQLYFKQNIYLLISQIFILKVFNIDFVILYFLELIVLFIFRNNCFCDFNYIGISIYFYSCKKKNIYNKIINIYYINYQVYKIKWEIILLNCISILFYITILIFMQEQFDINSIWQLKFIGYIIAIVILCWIPVYGFQKLKRKIDPTDHEKVMKKIQEKITNQQNLEQQILQI
ncbi:phospholipid-translocating p-type flippase family protein, putative, partial [Ichthyophthirius multifiliis]